MNVMYNLNDNIENLHQFHEEGFFGSCNKQSKLQIRELEAEIRHLNFKLQEKDANIKELQNKEKEFIEEYRNELKRKDSLYETVLSNCKTQQQTYEVRLEEQRQRIKFLESNAGKEHGDWDDILNNQIFSPENILHLKPGWTWYDVLCVDRNATDEIIKRNGVLLRAHWHPDQLNKRKGMNLDPRMTLNSLTETVKFLNTAIDILLDPRKRREYDQEIAKPNYKPPRWRMPLKLDMKFGNVYLVTAHSH